MHWYIFSALWSTVIHVWFTFVCTRITSHKSLRVIQTLLPVCGVSYCRSKKTIDCSVKEAPIPLRTCNTKKKKKKSGASDRITKMRTNKKNSVLLSVRTSCAYRTPSYRYPNTWLTRWQHPAICNQVPSPNPARTMQITNKLCAAVMTVCLAAILKPISN